MSLGNGQVDFCSAGDTKRPKGNVVIEDAGGMSPPLKAISGEFPVIHSNLHQSWNNEQSELES